MTGDVSMSESTVPLCVDFDGTLTLGSVRIEQLSRLTRRSPLELLRLLLPRAPRTAFWHELAANSRLDLAALPMRRELLDWLQLQRRAGRRLVLLAEGDQNRAERLANVLPLFDECALIDAANGSAAERKRRTLLGRFGERGFDFVGSDPADSIVWQAARRAVVIGDATLAGRVGKMSELERAFSPPRPTARAWIQAVRLHQWVKNALVFLPPLLAHSYWQAGLLLDSLLAFLTFGLCASSVYLINDLFDLAADRAHPRKRFRPLAAGVISARAALTVSASLLVAAAAIAAAVGVRFALILASYYVLTWAYSLRLKRTALLDVMVLAILYTIRIIAGAAATDVPLSFWLLAFSMFIFLSLGCVKRYAELFATRRAERPSNGERGYTADDLPLVMSLGTAAGYCAVVVLALYINSPDSEALYHHHKPLWLVCPLILFWISRAWTLTARGLMHDDPVVFAVRDPSSLVTLGLIFLVVSISV
jgi:4-hydroxybenzoate polyprenyltransferase